MAPNTIKVKKVKQSELQSGQIYDTKSMSVAYHSIVLKGSRNMIKPKLPIQSYLDKKNVEGASSLFQKIQTTEEVLLETEKANDGYLFS